MQEGRSSNDLGLYARCFDELIVLSKDKMSRDEFPYTYIYDFSVSIYEVHNEQIRDLLLGSDESFLPFSEMGYDFHDILAVKVESPTGFNSVLESAFSRRDALKRRVSHLIVAINIHYKVESYIEPFDEHDGCNKLYLIDLAGSGSTVQEDSGEHATELLHVMKSFSALGDILNSLASERWDVPYGISTLTQVLTGSLGSRAKKLLIVNICPNALNLSETLSSLSFSATIKKWGDIEYDTRKELYDKEKEITDLKRVLRRLMQEFEADDTHLELYDTENEITDLKQEANDTRKELYDTENEITDLKQEVSRLRQEMKGWIDFNSQQLDVKPEMQADDTLYYRENEFTEMKQEVSRLRQGLNDCIDFIARQFDVKPEMVSSFVHVKGADASPAVITDTNVEQPMETKSNDQKKHGRQNSDGVKTPEKKKRLCSGLNYNEGGSTTEVEMSAEKEKPAPNPETGSLDE